MLTQLVTAQALQHEKLLDEQAASIRAERSRLFDELERTEGVAAFPSEANFILFRTRAADATHAALRQRGVLIKNLHGSHPSLDGCLRVTVGTREENDRFMSALRASL